MLRVYLSFFLSSSSTSSSASSSSLLTRVFRLCWCPHTRMLDKPKGNTMLLGQKDVSSKIWTQELRFLRRTFQVLLPLGLHFGVIMIDIEHIHRNLFPLPWCDVSFYWHLGWILIEVIKRLAEIFVLNKIILFPFVFLPFLLPYIS